MKKPKRKDKINLFKLFTDILPITIQSSPVYFFLLVTSSLLMSVSFAAKTALLKLFFDDTQALYDGSVTIYVPLLSLFLLFLCIVLGHITNWAANFLPSCLLMNAHVKTSVRLYKKLAKLPPVEFENTDRLDDINKANEGRNAAIWFVGAMVMLACFYLPYFIFMGWYLFTLKPIFVWAIAAAFFPAAISQCVNVKVFSKAEDESAPVRRLSEHYADCLTSREYFKETRLLGGYQQFIALYRDSIQRLNRITMKATVKSNLIILCLNLITAIGMICILFLLVTSLLNGDITAGAFAAVFNSLIMLFSLMNEIINMHLKNITRNMGKIKNFISLMDMPERKGSQKAPRGLFGIELQNVTFAYPGAEENALTDINLTIRGGETIAVVGENGSGKSTLIRLMTGLYVPTEGVVTHGGISTADILPEELFQNTSAVFQKYIKYQMTLLENVSISDIDKPYDERSLDLAMNRAGIAKTDDSFTDGYHTMLSREFDGIDLSGGIWQKVAIARAFYKEHGLVVLDEPTAAIDPLEETKIYHRFAELSKGKTAIIVTHRLGSVKLADRILVMKDSRLAECGTHEELMNLNGEYKKLFLSQQKQYA